MTTLSLNEIFCRLKVNHISRDKNFNAVFLFYIYAHLSLFFNAQNAWNLLKNTNEDNYNAMRVVFLVKYSKIMHFSRRIDTKLNVQFVCYFKYIKSNYLFMLKIIHLFLYLTKSRRFCWFYLLHTTIDSFVSEWLFYRLKSELYS